MVDRITEEVINHYSDKVVGDFEESSINTERYERLGELGKGGSIEILRSHFYCLDEISLDQTDQDS